MEEGFPHDVVALCIRYLHRHPLELRLPAYVLNDLYALAALEADALSDAQSQYPLHR